MKFNHNKAFTLIELSIVLVIIGLLVGGIMGGQVLVQQAKIQKIGTLFNQYGIAVNTFRMQYNGLPGDITGTNFWSCSGVTNCNGDNNGQINSSTYEQYLFWYHLSQAGLVNGNFTGNVAGTFYTASTNCPNGPLGSCFGARYQSPYSFQTYNFIEYGAISSSGYTENGIISPKDAYALDVKFDDGLPYSGKILAIFGNDQLAASTPTNCTAATAWNASTKGAFTLTYTGNSCRVFYNIDQ